MTEDEPFNRSGKTGEIQLPSWCFLDKPKTRALFLDLKRSTFLYPFEISLPALRFRIFILR